jgi:hypothetical protein
MIRHIAVFRFRPEFSAQDRAAWITLLRDLPSHIPEIRSLSVGVDVGASANAYEIGLVADFDDLAALERYSTHPAHQKVLDISGPQKTALAVVDFVLDETLPANKG